MSTAGQAEHRHSEPFIGMLVVPNTAASTGRRCA